MSEFRTIVDVAESNIKIGYNSKLLFVGSCFAENIGEKVCKSKFNTLLNPFGIVYNPVSVANTLSAIIDKKIFSEQDLIYSNTWNSFYHHSRFSNESKDLCLENINDSCKSSFEYLKNTDFIVITFGTSWVYEYIETGKIVSNCHKLPSKCFNRYRLSIDEIVNIYRDLIQNIRKINPNVNFIFTVSPVRHWKDGANGNQMSKAVLHLAIDKIIKENVNVAYFPSYELVMDDLRDYRFYSEDMIHVSNIAVDYIWSKFIKTYIDDKSLALMKRIEKVKKAVEHRPFAAESDTYKVFLGNLLGKIEQLESECRYLNFSEEKEIILGKTANIK